MCVIKEGKSRSRCAVDFLLFLLLHLLSWIANLIRKLIFTVIDLFWLRVVLSVCRNTSRILKNNIENEEII